MGCRLLRRIQAGNRKRSCWFSTAVLMTLGWVFLTSSGCSLIATDVIFQFPEVGFSIRLPDSWQGYRVQSIYWEGSRNDPDLGDVVVESGPMVIIQHPASTPENPRQDIPIMILTIQQWEAMLAQEWHIGAAPIAPAEIGRNSQYVFALPARYNYAFPTGWEEVEEILAGQTISVSEPQGSSK
jgi:hypothetical protein